MKTRFEIEQLVSLTDIVKTYIGKDGYIITIEQEIPHGYQIRLSQGSIINIYCTGKISVQGKNTENVERLLGINKQ